MANHIGLYEVETFEAVAGYFFFFFVYNVHENLLLTERQHVKFVAYFLKSLNQGNINIILGILHHL